MKKHRNGFAVISLLNVAAIICILAAIAVPQSPECRQWARDAAAKTALKNLAAAQRNYYERHNTYIADMAQAGFFPETPIIIGSITAGPESWSATANHAYSTNIFTYSSGEGGLK